MYDVVSSKLVNRHFMYIIINNRHSCCTCALTHAFTGPPTQNSHSHIIPEDIHQERPPTAQGAALAAKVHTLQIPDSVSRVHAQLEQYTLHHTSYADRADILDGCSRYYKFCGCMVSGLFIPEPERGQPSFQRVLQEPRANQGVGASSTYPAH